jgi:hypothetical protein
LRNCLGAYIDKHLGAVGWFSTRQNANEFVTVLPNSDLVEVEGILVDLTRDFQENGIRHKLGLTRAPLWWRALNL